MSASPHKVEDKLEEWSVDGLYSRKLLTCKNDSRHNHVCIALSHDDSQNLLSLRCAHNLLLREIFLPTHCMIMHIPLVRAMHYAICTMPWFSREHRWFPPQSYALWEICIMRICVMRYSTVLVFSFPIAFTWSGSANVRSRPKSYIPCAGLNVRTPVADTAIV